MGILIWCGGWIYMIWTVVLWGVGLIWIDRRIVLNCIRIIKNYRVGDKGWLVEIMGWLVFIYFGVVFI
jgi:hypothetical protein